MKEIVMLVGSSFSALPLANKIKEKGFSLHIVGAVRDDPCHRISDKSYFIDYSKKKSVLNLVKKVRPKYLVPSCNDVSLETCTYISEIINFPGYDSNKNYLNIHKKDRFRSLLHTLGLPSPKSYDFDDKNIKFPLISKPTDSTSGLGIQIIESRKKLLEIKQNSKIKKLQLEEYIDGTLHSCSIFFKNKKAKKTYFVDEFCTTYDFSVNLSYAPSSLSSKIKRTVADSIATFCNYLNLSDGLMHVQFMVKKDKIYLIEAMRRCPGDLYPNLIKLSYCSDYWWDYLSFYLDKKLSHATQKAKYVSRMNIDISQDRIFNNFNLKGDLSEVLIFPYKTYGEYLKRAPYEKAAIIFRIFNKRNDLKRNISKMVKTTNHLIYNETF